MFYLYKYVCFICAIGSLSCLSLFSEQPEVVPLKEAPSKEEKGVDEEKAVSPHLSGSSLVVTSDGTRRLKMASGYAFFAKPSSPGIWEILGDMGDDRVSGVVKVLTQKRYAFSGTVFLKSGPVLTTQSVKILSNGVVETKDLVSDATYTFKKEDLQGSLDPSMSKERNVGFCVALAVHSVMAQPVGS